MSLTTVLLRDEFEDNRSVGAVNGTLATDGVSVRTVVDTNNYLSIANGNLVISNVVSYGNPRLYYPSINRQPGTVGRFNVSASSIYLYYTRYGFSSSSSSFSGDGVHIDGFPQFTAISGASNMASSAVPSLNMEFYIALRQAGAFVLLKSTYPVLTWINSTNAESPLYPILTEFGAGVANNMDRIIVAGYWLPVPISSDSFTVNGTSDGLGHAETSGIGSGGSGVAWSGATWSVSGGKAINTPTIIGDAVVNGNFSLWTGDNPDSWSVGGEAGSDPMITESSGKLRMFGTTGAGVYGSQNTLTIGKWYRLSIDIVSRISGSISYKNGFGSNGLQGLSAIGTSIGTIRADSTTLVLLRYETPVDITVDNACSYELAPSSLLSLHTSSTPDVFVGIDLTVAAGTQAGLALNWDSTSSPANGVIAYHDGSNCKLEKCVAGTWTTVISAAATYSANARLVVSKIGTAYRLYYNNALVGSGTIGDAGIINNTLHGLFSTDPSSNLDNYTCYASGSGGEYATAFDIAISAGGAAAGTSGTDANANRKRTANGASAGNSDASGATSVRRNVAGQSDGTGSANATGVAKRLASGQCAGNSDASGATSVRRNVAGQSDGTGSANATSLRKRLATGVAAGNGTATIHNHTVSATISS